MASNAKKLRSGYTTGACAAAAAKAATLLLLQNTDYRTQNSEWEKLEPVSRVLTPEVDIPFPDKSRHTFSISHSSLVTRHSTLIAQASVIKDAGDDPDITNGAEIVAEARLIPLTHPLPTGQAGSSSPHSGGFAEEKRGEGQRIISPPLRGGPALPVGRDKGEGDSYSLIIKGGIGVGTVTKPGLSVPVGEPAINPVPRTMIREAVAEAVEKSDKYRVTSDKMKAGDTLWAIEITISVPKGEELAQKTLNARLGIVGGISILGTSGIVRPLSAEAWTSSITAAMDVARAVGCEEVVLSAGRVSEKAHMKKYGLPVEAYVMMGDYVEFSLVDAKKHNFKKIHVSAHWAKMLKIAMEIPQTHVRHGAIDLHQASLFLNNLIPGLLDPAYDFNTAREIYDVISAKQNMRSPGIYYRVCTRAKEYAEGISAGIPVIANLVSYEGEIIAESE